MRWVWGWWVWGEVGMGEGVAMGGGGYLRSNDDIISRMESDTA